MVIKNKSAIKRIKIAERNHLQNKNYKSTIKTLTKKILLSKSNKDDFLIIQTKLAQVYSKIDKAVKKGIIPKNTAARKKSWLAKKCV